ncbi:MAG: 30S ribosome-binding factor RbfA [Bacteroidetes bacterium]|nr:30S ribosome-binding factor RbfA [Bacteroidota bacterium]
METKRQQRIARLIQKDLSELLLRELADLVHGCMITVTKVHVTPDLSLARIYLSIFGVQDKKAKVQEFNQRSREIRGFLGSKLRHQLRLIPELQFREDDSLDYIERIDNLLKNG